MNAVVRLWLYLFWTDRVFLCPECGKLWPRDKVLWETCGGLYSKPHELRRMKRVRVYGRMAPVERAATALAWGYEPKRRALEGETP